MMKRIVNRAMSTTPPFFKKLRNIGLALATVSAAIITAPVGFPVIVTTAAGYLTVAGAVATAISQLAVHEEVSSD